MNPRVLPPGEPNLVKAILTASKHVAGYVHRYEVGGDWYVGDSIPRDVPAYFRVFAGRIYARLTSDRSEHLFGRIDGGVIVQETE